MPTLYELKQLRTDAEARGSAARLAGKPKDANPHRFTSRGNNGLMLQAWWDAGWRKADRIAAQKKALEGEV